MIFEEIYSVYYKAISRIIESAVQNGSISSKDISRIVSQETFISDENSSIKELIDDNAWPFLFKQSLNDSDKESYSTTILNDTIRPLTIIEKRWLKAIGMDPRIALFNLSLPIDDGIPPLFEPRDYEAIGIYGDGDDYEDPNYIDNFRILLNATRDMIPVIINYTPASGMPREVAVLPERLEYSEKNDRFRLIGSADSAEMIINLSTVNSVSTTDDAGALFADDNAPRSKLVYLTTSERNTLERSLLHFAHYEKEPVERLSENEYRVTLYYDTSDAPELLLQILSFGPFIKVIEPTEMVELICSRLQKQIKEKPKR